MLYQGVVIKKTDSGEHSQLITLYTKEFGKLIAIAKSVKKNTSKQAGHLDVLNLVDFIFVAGKNYPIITSAQSLETFTGIKSLLSKNALALFVLEAVDNLVYDYDKDPALWDFLLKKLNDLDKNQFLNGDFEDFFTDLKKELVKVLGYANDLQEREINNLLISLSSRQFYSLQFIEAVVK